MIFNSYVSHYQRVYLYERQRHDQVSRQAEIEQSWKKRPTLDTKSRRKWTWNRETRDTPPFMHPFMHQTLKTWFKLDTFWKTTGYGSIPIFTIFRGMNIHLPVIWGSHSVPGFWPIPNCLLMEAASVCHFSTNFSTGSLEESWGVPGCPC